MHYYFSSWWGVHVFMHYYFSSWTEVYIMHYYFSSWWGVHVFMHVHLSSYWSSNVWTRTNFITLHLHELKCKCPGSCITTSVHGEVYMCSVCPVQHYYFSSWWGVHVIKFVLVHTLLLQFMVRCTCVHALLLQFMVRCTCVTFVLVHALLLQFMVRCTHEHMFMHYYFSSWWGVHVHLHNWSLSWFITVTCEVYTSWWGVHGSCITTSVHGEVYMWCLSCSCSSSLSCSYFSSWWGVHVIKFVLVHTLLLQFMVRCTCVHALLLQFMVRCTWCSCITTSVHGEVYMW